jgi:hypothetical protein
MVGHIHHPDPDNSRSSARRRGAGSEPSPVDEADRQRRMRRLDAWLDELDEQHGPPSTREVAEAVEWLNAAGDDGPGR